MKQTGKLYTITPKSASPSWCPSKGTPFYTSPALALSALEQGWFSPYEKQDLEFHIYSLDLEEKVDLDDLY